ncbi:MAG TPA: hypothetical protein VF945_02375 [Polyangia bacterium]
MVAPLRILPVLLLAGCLGGDFNSKDQGVTNPPDLSTRIFDIAGLDLFGLYNCTQLNTCDKNCTTAACVQLCKNMATPSAKALEADLQSCFQQFCPVGAGQVCAPDAMGMLSMACSVCINNTYLPAGASCSPTQNPDECHQCVQQANACTADM